MKNGQQPQCNRCGRFIPFKRATLQGKLEPPPMVGWVEWWEGLCERCDEEKAMDEGAKWQESADGCAAAFERVHGQ